MTQDTQAALSGGHWISEDVLSTVTTLVAGMLATGKHTLLHFHKPRRAESLNDVVDLAMEIHLAADKPFDVLLAEHEARQAKYAAWQDGVGLLLGVPAEALKAVDGDYDKLDKAALSTLGECDKQYSAQRAAVYQQIVAANGAACAIDVNLPAVCDV